MALGKLQDEAELERWLEDKLGEEGLINARNVQGFDVAVSTAVAAAIVPSGTVLATARATAPTGYLLCDGSLVSTTTYAALFAAIGHVYNAGVDPGGGNFKLPDFRGRVPVGVDGAAARLAANDALGNTAGAEKHQLVTAELPNHTHGLAAQGVAAGGTTIYAGAGSANPTAGTGGDTPHNNMQPYQVVNWMVKT